MDRIHTVQEGGRVVALHEHGNGFSISINYAGCFKIICATVSFLRGMMMYWMGGTCSIL
jgi:hypothetical protein